MRTFLCAAALIILLPALPSSAHDSRYCGHSIQATFPAWDQWLYSYRQGSLHIHVYAHYWAGWVEQYRTTRRCPHH